MLPTTTATTTVDTNSWKRLQASILAEKKASDEAEAVKKQCDHPDGPTKKQEVARNLLWGIQEKEFKRDALKEQIRLVSQLILSDKMKLAEVDEEIEKKRLTELRIRKEVDAARLVIEKNIERKENMQKIINSLTRLVTFRKHALIEEVFKVYNVRIDGGPASPPDWHISKKCTCHLINCIVGLHLPQSSMMLSHPQVETTAALSYFLQMYHALCKILSYNSPNPIDATSSPPTITNPVTGKVYIFANWRKKADRDRFVKAMLFLGQNISQLRMDCGFPTTNADETLHKLYEWLYLITNKEAVFNRPTCSIFSPASLLHDYKLL